MPEGSDAPSSAMYLPVELDRLRIVVDPSVFELDGGLWRPLENYRSFAKEGYQRELHGGEVPTFRLGPPKLSTSGVVLYQRPLPVSQSE